MGNLLDDLIGGVGCLFFFIVAACFLYWDWKDGWGWWTTLILLFFVVGFIAALLENKKE